MTRSTLTAVIAVLTTVLLALPTGAEAAFPGGNGRLAFSDARAIFVIDPGGGPATELTDPPPGAEDTQPAWAADGRRIAFTSTRANTNPLVADQDIYTMSADGSRVTNITRDPTQDDVRPAWSPDGRKIAYSTFNDIYITNADGSGTPVNFTNSHVLEDFPAWSPDGQQIAFERQDGIGTDIFVLYVDPSGHAAGGFQLTNDLASETHPAWSPDGSQIAFVRDAHIFVTDATGTGAESQVTSGIGFDSDPAWSPDGTQIAFSRDGVLSTIDANGVGTPRPVSSQAVEPDWQPLTTSITVQNAVTPSSAPGRFDLSVDSTVIRSAAGDGDAGTVIVDPGSHTVDASDLPDYTSSITCTKNRAPDVAGPGSSIDVDMAARDTEECTIAHAQGAATPVGSPVSVSPPDLTTGSQPVTIRFDDVQAGGITTLSTSATGPSLPVGFAIDGVYYELQTTAAFTSATVCFSYTGLPPAIVHWVGGIPRVDSNPPVVGGMVCTDVSSFSPFALARSTGDTEAPRIACGTADTDWHANNVTIACSAEDTGSSLADPTEASFSLSTSVPAGSEDADAKTGSRQVCDVAGNCATAGPIGANKVDRRAPALSLPAPITVDAASPQGATVTFSASALDGADPHPSLSCTPASGSTFPIGTDTVACAVTDHVGNITRGSSTITVRGAKDQLDRLVQEVVTAPKLAASLRSLVAGFDPGNATQRAVVCRALSDFVAAVRLLSGHGIPPATATTWIGDATRIRAVLACGGTTR